MNFTNYFSPNQAGYEMFREGVHNNCITGLLHTLFMPIASAGVFITIFGILCKLWNDYEENAHKTRKLLMVLIFFFYSGYYNYSPIVGAISLAFYYWFISYSIRRFEEFIQFVKERRIVDESEKNFIIFCGLCALTLSVLVMEFIGHWFIEDHASNVWRLANSIFQTPLYGTNSLIYPFTGECHW